MPHLHFSWWLVLNLILSSIRLINQIYVNILVTQVQWGTRGSSHCNTYKRIGDLETLDPIELLFHVAETYSYV